MNKLCAVSGKRCFASPNEAKRARRGLRSGTRVRAYLCPHCKLFHYTHQNYDHTKRQKRLEKTT